MRTCMNYLSSSGNPNPYLELRTISQVLHHHDLSDQRVWVGLMSYDQIGSYDVKPTQTLCISHHTCTAPAVTDLFEDVDSDRYNNIISSK